MSATPERPSSPRGFLPKIGSPAYYALLGAIAIFVLGPLGGVTASYMNFSLGFFVGGQVLAGILGSTVTYFYGPEGKHGANYMQTMAASVASMSAMGVLIQAMVWLGLPEPATWQLFLYFLCTGMFGVGVGMMYTPILVDKLQLQYPSGLAVANILRALTDLRLLKRSVGQLFSGIGVGTAIPLLMEKLAEVKAIAWLAGTGLSTSTLGAGMIVGARIGVPAIAYAFLWDALAPWLRSMGWLGEHDPYRKFAFLVALGTIMGAATLDIGMILREGLARLRAGGPKAEVKPGEEWKQTNSNRLIAWLVCWTIAIIAVTNGILGVPLHWVLVGVALAFVMMLVNGISLGISDSNPISSAFVVSVVVMATLGLADPIAGLFAGSIVFICCSIGGDMQQDRSTGWRLGTDRTIQFRFQVVGVLMGAVLAVYMAKLFMQAYPVLRIDTFTHPEALKAAGEGAAKWQSAMTFKFVGVIRGLTQPKSWQIPAMMVGFGIGLVTQIIRKVVKANVRYQAWSKSGNGFAFDFCFDAFLVPSPYATSFAGFVEFTTSMWFGGGGVVSSLWGTIEKRRAAGKPKEDDLPEDMSTTSLVGGGLIAGDSIAALVLGVLGLLALAK